MPRNNQELHLMNDSPAGILLVNKPKGKNSFSLVAVLRKLLHVTKIGHAGTLDPFATGVMVMLIGKKYTQMSSHFLGQDKEYLAELLLGMSTDSYDCDGQIVAKSDLIPTLDQVEKVLMHFQGTIEQIPPMYSAKKVNGKKLYQLARAGKVIERAPVKVTLSCQLIEYSYPYVRLKIACSKGTYVRSIAQDLGGMLGCGAHLSALERTRSGSFRVEDCVDGTQLYQGNPDLKPSILVRIKKELVIPMGA